MWEVLAVDDISSFYSHKQEGRHDNDNDVFWKDNLD